MMKIVLLFVGILFVQPCYCSKEFDAAIGEAAEGAVERANPRKRLLRSGGFSEVTIIRSGDKTYKYNRYKKVDDDDEKEEKYKSNNKFNEYYPRPDATYVKPKPTFPSLDSGNSNCGTNSEAGAVTITNKERLSRALEPLGCNTVANKVARAYSQYMCQKKCFSHGCDGRDAGARLDKAGFRWQRYAENIAMNYFDPVSVMRGWMNSPGHRNNILKRDVTEIGVGTCQLRCAYSFD